MGEAWRPEAGGSGGAGMLGAEGSITMMMAEHTCGSSGASSLSGPHIDRVGRWVRAEVHEPFVGGIGMHSEQQKWAMSKVDGW